MTTIALTSAVEFRKKKLVYALYFSAGVVVGYALASMPAWSCI